MNGVLFKNVGYSSTRMINILGRFTFNNIPIKSVMIESDKHNNNENTDEDDENDLTIIDNDDDDNDETSNRKCTYDKDQQIKINVRTYIKNGYNYTNVSDTTENYMISNTEKQPEERGIEYKDVNFRIQTVINNKDLKQN